MDDYESEKRKDYKNAIADLLEECNDLDLLDLVYILLRKNN